ncbi:hypothetical protein J6590_034585 [Homalodisca vitripennis]|nr:hypothetical protein J6590_034585 [Homalodisca vitripennis]
MKNCVRRGQASVPTSHYERNSVGGAATSGDNYTCLKQEEIKEKGVVGDNYECLKQEEIKEKGVVWVERRLLVIITNVRKRKKVFETGRNQGKGNSLGGAATRGDNYECLKQEEIMKRDNFAIEGLTRGIVSKNTDIGNMKEFESEELPTRMEKCNRGDMKRKFKREKERAEIWEQAGYSELTTEIKS